MAYDGSMFPEWQQASSSGAVPRLALSAGRVAGEARYLEGTGRIRDAVAGDGSILLLTDDGGQVLRVTRGN